MYCISPFLCISLFTSHFVLIFTWVLFLMLNIFVGERHPPSQTAICKSKRRISPSDQFNDVQRPGLQSWPIFRCGVDVKHLKSSDTKKCKYSARQSQLRYRQNFSQDWGDSTHSCTKNRNSSPSNLYLVLLVQKWSREGVVLSISSPRWNRTCCALYIYIYSFQKAVDSFFAFSLT